MLVVQHKRAEHLASAGFHAAAAFVPCADLVPADVVGEELAQFGLADLCGLTDFRLARRAVGVGHNDEPSTRERVSVIHHRALSARQDEARLIAFAAQSHAVGIGQRGHGSRRHWCPVRDIAGETFRLVFDPCESGAVGTRIAAFQCL